MKLIFLALWAVIIPQLAVAKSIHAPVPLPRFSTPLLPEVADILKAPVIDESGMTDNAYVVLMGIGAPKGEDYAGIGKKIILNNAEKLAKALAAQDLELMRIPDSTNNYYTDKESIALVSTLNDGERNYVFQCSDASNQHCLTKVIAEQAKVNQLINANQLLLERHKQIIKLPNYDVYFYSLNLPIPPLHYAMRLSNLRLAEAIFAVEQGNVEAGLAILEQEITYAKRILSSRAATIDTMVAIRQLLTAYHVVEQLLDTPQFANQLQSPRLLALLEPFTAQQQQSIARAVELDRDAYIQFLYMMQTSYRAEPQMANIYDNNVTLNLIYQSQSAIIKRAKLVLPEASEYFIKHPLSEVQQAQKNQLWWSIVQQVSAGNFFGANILKAYIPMKSGEYGYLYRFYALNNYLELVNLKLQIKQAGLTSQQVADYLVKVKAVNLYSQQPIVWNAASQQLTTDAFEKNNMFEDGVISVNVPFPQ